MKRKRLFLVLCVLMFAVLFGTAVSAAGTVAVRYDGTVYYDEANEVMELVNQERAARGLPALASDSQLQEQAVIRAFELALYYSHTRPDGTSGYDIVGTGYKRAENIAKVGGSAEKVMDAWMMSADHRGAILDSRYKQIGVACVVHNNNKYWVQLFRDGTGSGTLKTGTVNRCMESEMLSSRLDLYADPMSIYIENRQPVEITVYHLNTGPGAGEPMAVLRADSPVLSWTGSSDITLALSSDGSKLTVNKMKCGHGSVMIRGGSRGVYISVDKEHTGSEVSCVKGQACTDCGTQMQEAPGHDYTNARPTCAEYARCSRCGEPGGTLGDHVWGEWKRIAQATTESPEKQQRLCTLCSLGKETRYVGEKLPAHSGSNVGNGTVNADVKVSSIVIEGKTTLLAGKKSRLTVSVLPSDASDQKVVWFTGNKKYASVSADGVVTAKAAGAGKTVTITAMAADGSGVKDTHKIKIRGAVKKIKLRASKTLKAGKKMKIRATVTVGKGGSRALKWSTSKKKYATVNSKGVVTAKKAGKGKTVTITAKAKDGSGKKATIRIKIR